MINFQKVSIVDGNRSPPSVLARKFQFGLSLGESEREAECFEMYFIERAGVLYTPLVVP